MGQTLCHRVFKPTVLCYVISISVQNPLVEVQVNVVLCYFVVHPGNAFKRSSSPVLSVVVVICHLTAVDRK